MNFSLQAVANTLCMPGPCFAIAGRVAERPECDCDKLCNRSIVRLVGHGLQGCSVRYTAQACYLQLTTYQAQECSGYDNTSRTARTHTQRRTVIRTGKSNLSPHRLHRRTVRQREDRTHITTRTCDFSARASVWLGRTASVKEDTSLPLAENRDHVFLGRPLFSARSAGAAQSSAKAKMIASALRSRVASSVVRRVADPRIALCARPVYVRSASSDSLSWGECSKCASNAQWP